MLNTFISGLNGVTTCILKVAISNGQKCSTALGTFIMQVSVKQYKKNVLQQTQTDLLEDKLFQKYMANLLFIP